MIEVVVPCSCPGTPHAEDSVSMPDVADVRIGMAVMSAYNGSPANVDVMEGRIAGALLLTVVRDWTFTDEKGEPLPITPENIESRLTWNRGGSDVAERANNAYAEDVFAPLVRKRLKASPSTPTGSSTPPSPSPGSDTPSSAKPSLRTVTGGRRSAAKAS